MNRKPLEGVLNILRFNAHFFGLAALAFASVYLFKHLLPAEVQGPLTWLLYPAAATILVSLGVSWYVYDYSDLYRLSWLQPQGREDLLNIHAGFDETSAYIQAAFPETRLTICDFYDPARHTEISIRKARAYFPPAKDTVSVATNHLPFPDHSFDTGLAFLSAHEIRNDGERVAFFRELRRVVRPGGQLFVTEHLRDLPNFIAYTVGVFHFHSKACWLRTFSQAGWRVKREIKNTAFVTTFVLEQDGTTH